MYFPWNGSKRWMLSEIQKVTASWNSKGRYIEPFVGGGSVARMVLKQHPRVKAILGDANPWLAAWYQWQAQGEQYTLPPRWSDVEYWRGLSDADLSKLLSTEAATRFGVCLQTSWGNRWETHVSGQFRSTLKKVWCHPDYLQAKLEAMCAPIPALTGVTVHCVDWQQLASQSQPGDLLYLDPPYTETLGYGNQIWTLSNQLDVVDVAVDLSKRGVTVVVSNHADIDRLYRRAGFNVTHIQSGKSTKTRASRVEMLAWSNLDVKKSPDLLDMFGAL